MIRDTGILPDTARAANATASATRSGARRRYAADDTEGASDATPAWNRETWAFVSLLLVMGSLRLTKTEQATRHPRQRRECGAEAKLSR